MKRLTRAEASAALPDWRQILGRLQLGIDAGSFPAAVEFVNEVARIAEEQQHHPEIDVRFSLVHLAVASHDVGAVTDRDVTFATAVSRLVAERGLSLVPARLAEIEIAIDAIDVESCARFWQAITGYDLAEEDELRDPDRIGPTIWFQQMDEPRPHRNRIHLDLTVPHDQAQHRLGAALCAGGKLLDDTRAPSYWVLADPEGNEVCICTWQAQNSWFRAPTN